MVSAVKGRSSPSTLSKLRKIKSLKPGPQPNLSAAVKRRKTGLLDDIPAKNKKENFEELNAKIEQLFAENQRLKLLLEENERRSNAGQSSQVIVQCTPNIGTKNRYEKLGEESLSDHENMETDARAEERTTFLKVLRDKNNKKTNKYGSQPPSNNNTQTLSQSSGTPAISQNPARHNTNTNNKGRGSAGTPPSLSQEKGKRPPPPINIFNQDPKDTWKLAKEILVNATFHIKRISDSKHILQVDSVDNFKKVKQALLEANTNFFSYTPKEDKHSTFLLKGLNQTFDTQEILEELNQQGLENISFNKVSRFTTRRSIQECRVLPIFLVQLTADSNAAQLWKLKSLFHHIISWEKLHRKDAIQCKRCQRIGHAAANCNLSYRCVKCKEDHKPGECAVVYKDNSEVFCINCRKTGHPASYRGCPVLLELKNRLNNKQQSQRQNKVNRLELISKTVRPNLSFADAVGKGANKPEKKSFVRMEASANDGKRAMKVDMDQSQSESQIQFRLDRLEKSMEIINNRLDTLTNLIVKIYSKDD